MPRSDGAVLCIVQSQSDCTHLTCWSRAALPTPTKQTSTGCLLFALSKEQLGIPSSLVKWRELYEDRKGLLGTPAKIPRPVAAKVHSSVTKKCHGTTERLGWKGP